MTPTKPPLSNRLIEHLPQTARLRSGLYVGLRNRSDTGEFWHVFSSREYMALVPHLIQLPLSHGTVIDCGAGIGLFSLLMEHLCRVGVLPWSDLKFVLIEPGAYNFAQLKKNLARNLPAASWELLHGMVGQRDGEASFYESRRHPWSSSVVDRPGKSTARSTRSYVNLSKLIPAQPCLLKMDIEGAEFRAIETYHDELRKVSALIIEWHGEMGDISASETLLHEAGLRKKARSWDNGDRLVDLYVREGFEATPRPCPKTGTFGS